MKIRIIITTLIALVLIQSCKSEKAPIPDAKVEDELFMLSFPTIPLKDNERIVGLEVTITHGSVKSINNIPEDWSIDLKADPQWQPKVTGVAHHGAGALTETSQLQSFLTIRPWTGKWFVLNVEAKLFTTTDFEKTKTLSFKMTDLRLTKKGS